MVPRRGWCRCFLHWEIDWTVSEELLPREVEDGTNADVNPRKPNSVRVVANNPPINLRPYSLTMPYVALLVDKFEFFWYRTLRL